MDIEIKIGREAEGHYTFKVPASFTKVSRNHATLFWHDGVATIVDNKSTNGTFVNNRRITSSDVTGNDLIWLGGNGTDEKCYRLNLKQLLADYRLNEKPIHNIPKQQAAPFSGDVGMNSPQSYNNSNNLQRSDYSAEFDRIKQAYINYHEEVSTLTRKASTRMQLPKILMSTIPALLGVVIMLVSKDMTMRIVAMSAGTVLSGLISTLTMGKSTSKKEKLTEDLLDLQLKYQKEYKCPKCGKEYSLDLHWKKIKAEGKCPYGCGATF